MIGGTLGELLGFDGAASPVWLLPARASVRRGIGVERG